MAEPKVVALTPAPEDPPPTSGKKIRPLFLVAGAAVLGLAVGAAVLAPRLSSPPKKSATGEAAALGEPAEDEKGKPGEEAGGPGATRNSVLEIEKVVVNPVGSEGLHFLMATVSLDIKDKRAEEYLRKNEFMVRDVVITALGSLTMEELCQPGSRDRLKAMIAEKVGYLIGDSHLLTVYLPDFVVQ